MGDVNAFRRALRKSLERNEEAFDSDSDNRQMLNELLGLSKEELAEVVPGGVDEKTYADLISVVKEATRHNVNQAELKNQIENLGGTAVAIAKRVSSLALLFA